jgi:hypothetical protein
MTLVNKLCRRQRALVAKWCYIRSMNVNAIMIFMSAQSEVFFHCLLERVFRVSYRHMLRNVVV